VVDHKIAANIKVNKASRPSLGSKVGNKTKIAAAIANAKGNEAFTTQRKRRRWGTVEEGDRFWQGNFGLML